MRERIRRSATKPMTAPVAAARSGLGAGKPLDVATRVAVESSTGLSLADIRVHADPAAASCAERLSARAFTVGRDLVFGAGEYAPSTSAGRELIAHEIGHALQQRAASLVPGAPRVDGARAEGDADAFARSVVAGRAASVTTAAPLAPALKRKHESVQPPVDLVVAMRIVRSGTVGGDVDVTTSLGNRFHYSVAKLAESPLMLPPGTFTFAGTPRRGLRFGIDLPGVDHEQIALKLRGGASEPAPEKLVFAKKLPIEVTIGRPSESLIDPAAECGGGPCVTDDEIESLRPPPSLLSQRASKWGVLERWNKCGADCDAGTTFEEFFQSGVENDWFYPDEKDQLELELGRTEKRAERMKQAKVDADIAREQAWEAKGDEVLSMANSPGLIGWYAGDFSGHDFQTSMRYGGYVNTVAGAASFFGMMKGPAADEPPGETSALELDTAPPTPTSAADLELPSYPWIDLGETPTSTPELGDPKAPAAADQPGMHYNEIDLENAKPPDVLPTMDLGTYGRSGLKFHLYNTAESSIGYRYNFDPSTKQARWIEFDKFPLQSVKLPDRPSRFGLDPEIPPEYQMRHDDYTGTDLERGHGAGREAAQSYPEALKDLDKITNIWPMKGRGAQGVNQSVFRDAERGWGELAGEYGHVRVRIEAIFGAESENGISIPSGFTVEVRAPDGTVLSSSTILNQ